MGTRFIKHLAVVTKEFEITLINNSKYTFEIDTKLIVLMKIGKNYIVSTENMEYSFTIPYEIIDTHTEKYDNLNLYHIYYEYNLIELIKEVPKKEKIENSKNKLRYLFNNNPKKVTLNYVAETLGVSRQLVSTWRNGTGFIPSKHYKVLCEIFEVNEDYFDME